MRRLAGLIAIAIAVTTLVSPSTASASEMRSFTVTSATAGNGTTRVAGKISWSGRKSAYVYASTADLCPDDAWIAVSEFVARFEHRTVRARQFDNGCGDGRNTFILHFFRTRHRGDLKFIRVYGCEMKGTTGELRDCRRKTFTNPYL